jgi:predicted permease
VPALRGTAVDVHATLKDTSRGVVGARSLLARALLVVQVAMSLVLLVGAGLFLQSLRNAHRIDLGFEPRNLLLLTTDLRLNGYTEPAGREFYRRLLERAAALPGVTSVSLASRVPLGLEGGRRGITIEGYEPRSGEDMEVHTNSVGPAYFRTMGGALARGRDFSEADGPGAPGAVIVNEAFARRYWPGQDPLEKRIWMGSRSGPRGSPFTVIGVARDGKYVTLGEEPTPFFYLPFFQRYGAEAKLHVRTAGDPRTLVAAVRNQARALDPSLPFYDVKTMTDHLGLALLPARVAGSVLGLFGFVAVVLAAVGIYGVMAHSVSQRTRELGVRMALGARPGDLLSMVLAQGIRLAAIGVGLGLVAALAVSRLIASLLYGVSATDVATFVAVPLLLTGVALLASYLPAWRATQVDPIVALRYD